MKKLIVLATLAALPAAAMADVVISGNLTVAIQNTKGDNVGSHNDMTRNSGELKFSGTEDLGNGLKAIWQVANRLDPAGDETTNSFNSRDTFVGLQGAFGKVRFGKLSNPTNSGFSGDADVFSQIGLHGDGSYKTGEKRLANSIRYDSPVIAGFSAAVSHQLKETTAANSQPSYSNGLGLKYDAGMFAAIYSGTATKNGTAAGATDHTNQFTVLGNFDALGVNFGYGDSKTTTGANVKKTRGYGVSATYAVGNVTPKVGYWKETDSKTNGVKADDDFSVASIGAEYALSKRTVAGAELQKQSDKGNANNTGVRIAAVYFGTSF